MSEMQRSARDVDPARPRSGDSAGGDEYEPGYDPSRLLSALRRHQVTIACVVLIAAQLAWKAAFLSHYYFSQDDFRDLDIALRSHLSWSFLTHVETGHFFPGVWLICWVLARVALYNWAAASAVVLVMIAGASVAAWRLLRTLLGNRPAILIPLALYLVSPLTFPDESWWIAAVETIPLQIAIFMALNSHVRYARTGRFRHAIAATAWMLFGLCFFEKAVLIPLLLFAVTAGFLSTRRTLLAAMRVTLVRLWKGWVLYLALAAAYVGVFLASLPTSTTQPGLPGSAHLVFVFAGKLMLDSLLPGVLGGPWHWLHATGSQTAYASPPAGLAWLSLILVLALLAASILTRKRAWRAWAILAAWVVVADMAPIVIGRLIFPRYAAILGMTTRYVADVPAVLLIVIAVAFWPLAAPGRQEAGRQEAGRQEAGRSARRDIFTGRWKAVAIGAVAVVAVGSIWSVQRFQALTGSAGTVTSTYVANARAAIAEVPAGTVIVNQSVPASMMIGAFLKDAETSAVLKPLSHRGSKVTWTSAPQGTIDQLRVFGSDGRLWPAAVAGSTTKQPLGKSGCTAALGTRIALPFATAPVSSARALRIGYLAGGIAAGIPVTVTYGTFTGQFIVRQGEHHVYFAVSGSAPSVVLRTTAGFDGMCVAPAVAGKVVAFPADPIPATSQN